MKTIQYEKPTMKFVDIRNQKNVADNCWHLDANGTVKEWYYDYDDPETPGGDGYVKFSMGGNCNATIGEILEWHDVPEGVTKDDIQKQLTEDAAKFNYTPGSIIRPEPPTPGEWS